MAIKVVITFDDTTPFDGCTAAQACRMLRHLVRQFPEPDDIPDDGGYSDEMGAKWEVIDTEWK